MNVKEYLSKEDGVTVVEIILVLLVLIALVVIFKEQLTSVVNNILSKVASQSNAI
ncbi:MAG: holin, BlyA family protein [Lachnospiraceae bacterium]|nr:holin, BlyA family protein [Candidatus Equihabitans merdae]